MNFQALNNIIAVLQRPDFWTRAGMVFLGISLIVIGVVMFILTNKEVRQAATSVGKIAASKTPQGAAAVAVADTVGD